ncbi:hypothetical protein BDF21DRAFT_56349 [Thamnidium elegans]|nr:hypothetical protein BDF21DRAFT_56349 [Thamnidium elegans]
MNPLVSNNEKNPVQFNEKSPVRSIEKSLIRLLFELVAFYYTFILTFYLEEYAALYGQEILLSIRNNYFYPLIKYHFVSIFLFVQTSLVHFAFPFLYKFCGCSDCFLFCGGTSLLLVSSVLRDELRSLFD